MKLPARSALAEGLSTEYSERDRILDIARAEFIDYGFERTTIANIARRAGISRVTVNRRCGDKDQIILSVVQRELNATFRDLARRCAAFDEPVRRAVEIFVGGWQLAKQNSLVAAVMRHEPQGLQKLMSGDPGFGALDIGREMWASLITGNGCSSRAANAAAELLVRLTASLLLIPATQFDLNTEESARRFAETFMVPIVTSAIDANPETPPNQQTDGAPI
ncbi:TetR/AcrR family transcriptional regulator [Mycobacterium koreense]|uniref:Uncharacterized protein n=1 Tax=Mycolicibacillus koreensis TaxID=1069220 RepID=A0A7I7SFV9_9MYCO|nr:TetR/AcrR family transcriptional regulator [Mycolicibacillus koreensis]MCV7250086.1 TetR/AcrR family transcriptional regulator [Mycolicibacillus koreensis]OSC26242.1 hypothetical protein B8W67_18545 [Mycolicibacillus koreensis]BBY55814.1 putative transcriptional regulator, TetR family protein [Mycolicibacillus koreensis]